MCELVQKLTLSVRGGGQAVKVVTPDGCNRTVMLPPRYDMQLKKLGVVGEDSAVAAAAPKEIYLQV